MLRIIKNPIIWVTKLNDSGFLWISIAFCKKDASFEYYVETDIGTDKVFLLQKCSTFGDALLWIFGT